MQVAQFKKDVLNKNRAINENFICGGGASDKY